MRPLILALAVTLVTVAPGLAQAPAPAAPPARPAPQVEKNCPARATVTMDFSAGEYVVKGSPDNKLRLWWTTRDAADASKVYAKSDVSGNDARVWVSGPSNGFHVTIEVPSQANATVSMSAGKLTLGSLDGNIDVSAWAGEMNVGMANPANYYSAYASVTAGEIDASAFSARKGGVFRSFSWDGKGQHSVRVRLTAGKIVLFRDDAK